MVSPNFYLFIHRIAIPTFRPAIYLTHSSPFGYVSVWHPFKPCLVRGAACLYQTGDHTVYKNKNPVRLLRGTVITLYSY